MELSHSNRQALRMLDKKMPLSMLVDEMKMYPQCLKNVKVKSKTDAQNDPDVQAAVKVTQNFDVAERISV